MGFFRIAKMSRTLIAPLFLMFFSILFSSGCSSTAKDTNTAEGAFQAAEEYEKDEMYEEAIQKYSETKNKFPYSRYAVEAELRIADVQFKREAWIEAQNSYQLFKDLHPKHQQIAYVTYRLALSYFNQLPSTIDRDLSVAEKAIYHFDEIVKSFSNSEYVVDAKAKKVEARKMLGEKVLYIADFYFIRDMFDSALLRYEKLYREFNGEGFAPKALLGVGLCALETGDRAKAEQSLTQLIKEHAGAPEATRADEALRKHGIR